MNYMLFYIYLTVDSRFMTFRVTKMFHEDLFCDSYELTVIILVQDNTHDSRGYKSDYTVINGFVFIIQNNRINVLLCGIKVTKNIVNDPVVIYSYFFYIDLFYFHDMF